MGDIESEKDSKIYDFYSNLDFLGQKLGNMSGFFSFFRFFFNFWLHWVFTAVRGFLIAVASLVAEHGL